MEIVKIENLTFTYPRSTSPAISNISLTINEGDFVTLCGKSGCGKTTLLRLFKPLLSPHGKKEGKIFFEKKELGLLSQREQCKKIGFVLQSPDEQIVTDKVWHELAFGLESLGMESEEIRARVSEMAIFFGITPWFHKKTSELSGGQKQLLNLASVMVMQPTVLILDEPTSQLDPIAASDFLGMLKKINRELGTTIILSEHRLEEAFPMSDKVIVLEKGKLLAMDVPQRVGEALKENDMLKALPTPMRVYYAMSSEGTCPITVGEGRVWLETKAIDKNIEFEEKKAISGENAVSLENVWFRYDKNEPDTLKGLSLEVKKGEMYAIVGGNGVGKTTTLSVVSSVLKPYRGKVNLSGKVSLLPQSPDVLFTNKTVYDELKEMKSDAMEQVAALCELGPFMDRHPYDLSGGEKQRLGLAKILLTSPDILLLDEPTKGLDAHFKEKLANILSALKKGGTTIILVSHDIEFCAKYADRCGMLFEGQIVSQGKTREFFSGKSFYTTASNRMAKKLLERAIIPEDIILALGGKIDKKCDELTKFEMKKPETEKADKKITPKNIIFGTILFALLLFVELVVAKRFDGILRYVIYGVEILLLGLSLNNFLPQKRLGFVTENQRTKLGIRTKLASALVLIAIPLTIIVGNRFFGEKKYLIISLLIILETMLPFFMIFENRKPKARELVIISILCAIAVLGRTIFAPLPQFKPLIAIVIISAVCFGGETGFLVGTASVFVSNFFLSQGPWTSWQMFAAGIIGFIAGILFEKGFISKTRSSLCIFGGIATLIIYGGIMNPASVIIYQPNPTAEMLWAAYGIGLPMDIVHAVSTMFFLWFVSPPMIWQLDRMKLKYGIVK